MNETTAKLALRIANPLIYGHCTRLAHRSPGAQDRPVRQESDTLDFARVCDRLPASCASSRSTTSGRRIRVHIELEHRRLDTEIIFVEQLVLPYGLLGRRTIFSQFNEVVFL